MKENIVVLPVSRFQELIEIERQYSELKRDDTDYVCCHSWGYSYQIRKRDKVLSEMAEQIQLLEQQLDEVRKQEPIKRRWYEIFYKSH